MSLQDKLKEMENRRDMLREEFIKTIGAIEAIQGLINQKNNDTKKDSDERKEKPKK